MKQARTSVLFKIVGNKLPCLGGTLIWAKHVGILVYYILFIFLESYCVIRRDGSKFRSSHRSEFQWKFHTTPTYPLILGAGNSKCKSSQFFFFGISKYICEVNWLHRKPYDSEKQIPVVGNLFSNVLQILSLEIKVSLTREKVAIFHYLMI